MKRKSFVREMGWSMLVALACIVFLTGSQVYLEVIGDEFANAWTWAMNYLLIFAITMTTVMVYQSVRRHNAKVDEEAAREDRFLEHLHGPGEE